MNSMKKLVAPLAGLNPAGAWSAVQKLVLAKAGMQSLLLTLTLMVAALGVGSAVAAEKKMVMDPTTGEMVEAPRYGGTFTQVQKCEAPRNADIWFSSAAHTISGVIEKLSIGNWAIPRDEYNFNPGFWIPEFARTGHLAESWEQPDPTTYVLNIRQGVHWHNKAPMNSREFDAYDVEWNYHRYAGLGKFADAGPSPYARKLAGLPLESITATDKWTVEIKLKQPNLGALLIILGDTNGWILPPEVIEQHGDLKDWRNLVGTGPFMLTEWVFGSSMTWTRNPDYWDYDEKYPENRLPYVDEYRGLVIKENESVIAALRSGKLDLIGIGGCAEQGDIDVVESVMQSNPEIVFTPVSGRMVYGIAPDVRKPPFNDIRVRIAMQKALDLETISETWAKGWAETKPEGMIGSGIKGYNNPFEEWPEEIQERYTYDPEGAEKLLDEAGYPRGADGIRFKTTWEYYFQSPITYAEILVEYFRAIGVEVEIFIQDRARHVSSIKEHTYDGMVNALAGWDADPVWLLGGFHTDRSLWNRPGVQDPVYDAMVEAAEAATTIEEQKPLVKKADMYVIEKHWQIWGLKMPFFVVLQPWVKGYNGEYIFDGSNYPTLWTRLWIDQELKKEMGH